MLLNGQKRNLEHWPLIYDFVNWMLLGLSVRISIVFVMIVCLSDCAYVLFVCLVGAGSAGCVLASRLSEDPDVSVLLLEAGGSEEDTFMIRMPFAALELQNTEVDWAYRTQPQRKACLGMDQQVRFYLFQLYNNLTLQSSTGRGFLPLTFYVLRSMTT